MKSTAKCVSLVASLALLSSAADLEISRPVRSWEFVDSAGPRASWLGQEDGTLEAYVYPLKIVKDLRLRFRSDDRVIPGEAIARGITVSPGVYRIVYTGDDFRVTETLVASISEPGGVLLLDVTTRSPLRIDVEFTRDFQLMWPASIGSGYGEWNAQQKAFLFGADGQPLAAVLGSPDGQLLSREYAANYSGSAGSGFTLGTITGHGERTLAFAGSMKSRDEALAAYRRLLANPSQIREEAERHYRDYLAGTVRLVLPETRLQQAYDWSRVSMLQGFVDNPFLGRGLVAGYGPSKGAYRPGYAWFFGRDSFWTSLALSASGDFAGSRSAIAFISKFQREDGKLPHEISQAASLVPWFKDFPYGYASADATPLFVIAMRDYVQASGDVAFAREQAPHLWKAIEFMRSTLDEAGFPKNFGVGHGWVEGGPLLPVRVELYQAGCYVEALRAMATLARALGDARADSLSAEADGKRKTLNERFWLPGSHAFAFALDQAGKPVDQPSVLATVPMWFELLDLPKAQQMIGQLASERHATDWGMRIISSANPLYDPSGYHFGSVWPLFTGWASVGEYRSHQADAGLANLRANAFLALDGAGGNVTEVLSGDSYSPLSTASPHQIWSAAMVVSPLLKGMLGLGTDALRHRAAFAPHLPADWTNMEANGIPFQNGKVDLNVLRSADTLTLQITNNGAANFDLDFAPAYPLCAKLTSAVLDGKPITWRIESGNTDWHPHLMVPVKAGKSTLVLRHSGWFGWYLPVHEPRLAEASTSLKIISENWTNNGRTVELTVSGRPGREYRLGLANADQVSRVEGAARDGNNALLIRIPAGPSSGYVDQRITIALR